MSRASVSIPTVRRGSERDVLKILVYVVSVLVLGALLAPWIYNLGKALAEVTEGKKTNAFVDWFAAACRRSDFSRYFDRSVLVAALVLFFPIVRWMRAGRSGVYRDTPWSLLRTDNRPVTTEGQPLRRNPRGPFHLLFGFLVAAGGLLALGWLLVRAGFFVPRNVDVSSQGVRSLMPVEPVHLWKIVKRSVGPAFFIASVEETVFRGVLLGIFLRAMRPVTAILSLALLFSALHFLNAPSGMVVKDPESASAGLRLLGQILTNLLDPLPLLSGFLTLTGVGAVLSYARWRTASLWMPIGLHAGWVFGIVAFKAATWPVYTVANQSLMWVGYTLREGLVPLATVLLTGVVVHVFTRNDRGIIRVGESVRA